MNTEVRKDEQFSSEGQADKNQNLAKRFKAAIFFPLLLLPFFTLAFWALGGGTGKTSETKVTVKEGLNVDLPAARFKNDGKQDKLSFYEKAHAQELKDMAEFKGDSFVNMLNSRNDSNELDDFVQKSPSQYDPAPRTGHSGLNTSPSRNRGSSRDMTEDKIMQRLGQLQQEINKPQPPPAALAAADSRESKDTDVSGDVDRLESMMKMYKDGRGSDPEMEQIDGMLEKIIDIQHPDRVKEKLKEKSMKEKEAAFPVMANHDEATSSLLLPDSLKKQRVAKNAFYGSFENGAGENQNAVEAVVHETQTLVNGASIKLRLVNDIYCNGVLIPKGNTVVGIASIEGERLKIEIRTIRYKNSLFPVNLDTYDIDGLLGINIPGAITRDVMKRSADNAMQGMELTSLNPSIGAQAAAAGISTAKSLISKNVKLVKVTVKAGYNVLLWSKDNDF